MSTLHERLGDLAGSAPVPPPDPDLWDRARRYHRRRRIGTAAVAAACVLAVAALVGLDTWQRGPSIEPAAPGTDPALPARFWEPSPWLPGNDGEPTGPLAALRESERKSFLSSGNGVVGVSATTGEYRFLDLPDDAGRAWALSPDGAKVAYWLTGETTGTPQTDGGQSAPVVGVAVWDARTGAVTRGLVETEHGLADYDLLWASPVHVGAHWGEEQVGDDAPMRKQGGSLDRVGLRVWDVTGDAGPQPLGVGEHRDTANGRGLVLLTTQERPVLDVTTAQRSGPDGRRTSYGWVSALSPDGEAVAYPRGRGKRGRLVVRAQDSVVTVAEGEVEEAVAWTDDDTVVFTTRDREAVEPDYTFKTVSVSTGEQRVLFEAGPFQPLPGNLATDLLAVEPRDFAEPASPWNPRIVAGLLGFAVLVALMWLWGWRRSARP